LLPSPLRLRLRVLGALGEGAAPERAFEVVVCGEAAQHYLDRTLPVPHVSVCDVGEHAALGRLFDESSDHALGLA
jgi:hypothetical protein